MNGLGVLASLLLAVQASGSAPVLEPSCTAQMKHRRFTTQNDAKAFGRTCLVRQGAIERKLTRAQVVALLTPLIDGDHPLVATNPLDSATFCPTYASLVPQDRALVWRTLIAAIARPESNYQATEPYWEKDQGQYSIGLLQLSLADEQGYRCGLKSEVDLTKPEANLACGVRIMTRLVAGDRGAGRRRKGDLRIGGDRAHLVTGGARYWSTLRVRAKAPPGAPSTSARDEILASVRALPVCQARR